MISPRRAALYGFFELLLDRFRSDVGTKNGWFMPYDPGPFPRRRHVCRPAKPRRRSF